MLIPPRLAHHVCMYPIEVNTFTAEEYQPLLIALKLLDPSLVDVVKRVLGCIFSGIVTLVVCLGYAYPALASAKTAVQQDPAAFTQWMTYWAVMSVFAMVEIIVDFFVSWVPFYYEAKIVLIVWLTLPRYQGASRIYRRFLSPYLEQYEGDIDNGLEGMRVEATRRIQSLGATAATEIARAVTRQGSSAKEQLLARVLGIAAAGGAGPLNDRSVVHSAPPTPRPRQAYEARSSGPRDRHGDEDTETDEDVAEADAGMLGDFKNVMMGGVFVEARSAFLEGGHDSWQPRKIRMVRDRTFRVTGGSSSRMSGDSDDDRESVGQGRGDGQEQEFKVWEAESRTTSDRSLLVLRTDRGLLEVSLPEDDDRDSMLVGFELLLASLDTAAGGGDAPELAPRNEKGVIERASSRRWEHAIEGGGRGTGGQAMVLGSSDEESDDDSGDGTPPAMMSPLPQNRTHAE